MPLTEFQTRVLLLLKSNRNPNSYVAGGAAIHRSRGSSRLSRDIDFFHDTDEAVAASAKADLVLLKRQEFSTERLIDQPSFVRAVIGKDAESLKLEWVRDTAFRFFPVLEDDNLGWRLDDVDLMVNKCLALANRSEVRDIIDVIQMDREVLSLQAACWAACGKDPGFTPELLLDCMKRNSVIRPEQLSAEYLARPLEPVELKKEWLALALRAETALKTYPAADIGCLYLTSTGQVVREPVAGKLHDKQRHYGSIGGSWPRIVA